MNSIKVLQRKKDILLALSKVTYGFEKELHKQFGGTDNDLHITYLAVNQLCKDGYVKSMWKDKDIALTLTMDMV